MKVDIVDSIKNVVKRQKTVVPHEGLGKTVTLRERIKKKIPKYRVTERTVRKVTAAAVSAFILGLETDRRRRY